MCCWCCCELGYSFTEKETENQNANLHGLIDNVCKAMPVKIQCLSLCLYSILTKVNPFYNTRQSHLLATSL